MHGSLDVELLDWSCWSEQFHRQSDLIDVKSKWMDGKTGHQDDESNNFRDFTECKWYFRWRRSEPHRPKSVRGINSETWLDTPDRLTGIQHLLNAFIVISLDVNHKAIITNNGKTPKLNYSEMAESRLMVPQLRMMDGMTFKTAFHCNQAGESKKCKIHKLMTLCGAAMTLNCVFTLISIHDWPHR